MKGHPVQTNFTGGEISPLMRGRIDVKKFQNGASLIQNQLVHPQGGIRRRFGTRHVYQTKLSSGSRLLPFSFSDQQAYVLEFGDQYIHFIKNKERLFETTTTEIEGWTVLNDAGLMMILADSTPDDLPGWGDINAFYSPADNGTAIQSAGAAGVVRITTSIPHTLRTGTLVFMCSNANPNSINNQTYTVNRISNFVVDLVGSTFVSVIGITDTAMFSHGLLPGDRVFFSGGPEYPELTEQFHTVARVSAYDRFTVANVAYVNHGTPTGEEVHCIPIEISTPYTSAELAEIQVAQSADVLYIVHPNHPVMKLTRLDDDGDRNDWLLSTVDFYDGPYLPLNSLAPNVDTASPQNGSRYVDVYLNISAYTHTATARVTGGGTNFVAGDVSKYLEYRERDQWRLALVTAQTGASATVSIIDNVMLYMDESTKLKSKADKPAFIMGTQGNSSTNPTYNRNRFGQDGNKAQQQVDNKNSIGGATAAGNLTSQFANTFGSSDIGRYVRYGTSASNPPVFHWALVDGTSNTTGTTVHHATALSTTPGMTANNGNGKFVLTNEVKSCIINSFRAGVAFNMFAATDVGRHMRLGFGGRWAWGKITTFTSASQVTVTLTDELPRDPHNALNIAGNQDAFAPTTGVTYDWRLGSWSATTGYPSNVVFHEQRLTFGKTVVEPQSFWMSRSADYEGMSPTEPDGTVLDDNAVAYTITSGKISPINWMVSGPVLLIGGLGQEWQVRASGSTQEPVTPTNIIVTPQTDFGSAETVRAHSVGPATLFVDRVHRKLREMTYNFELDRHVATDVSIVSEHLFRLGLRILDMEYQKNPISTIWLLTPEGQMLTMTYEKDHEVSAWSQQVLGGGFVYPKSICSIAAEDNIYTRGHDEVYILTQRLNGYTVEVLFRNDPIGSFYSVTALHEAPFMDDYTYIANPASSVITGLDYYEGRTVDVYVDGVQETQKVVTGGSITTTAATPSQVTIGFIPTSRVRLIPGESGAILGTSQTKTKRINKIGLRVLNTSSVKVRTLDAVISELRTFPTTFYSGDILIPVIQGYNNVGEIELVQDLNAPLEILLAAPEGATYEEQ